jgi:hypothetical protein
MPGELAVSIPFSRTPGTVSTLEPVTMVGNDGQRKGFSRISAFNVQLSPEEFSAAFWDPSTGRGSSLVVVVAIVKLCITF